MLLGSTAKERYFSDGGREPVVSQLNSAFAPDSISSRGVMIRSPPGGAASVSRSARVEEPRSPTEAKSVTRLVASAHSVAGVPVLGHGSGGGCCLSCRAHRIGATRLVVAFGGAVDGPLVLAGLGNFAGGLGAVHPVGCRGLIGDRPFERHALA